MAEIKLKKHPRIENAFILDGLPVRHWASQGRDVEGIKWAKDIKREDYRPLPDHEYCIYSRTKVEGVGRQMKDVFYMRDDDEVHIFEIL